MKRFKRIFLIVLDSVGIGELPDAKDYNDEGAHTLGHIAERMDGLNVPNLAALGLGHIEHLQGVSADAPPVAAFGKMKEISLGKDTTTGHWEIMGLRVEIPFKTWPNGFPESLIAPFSEKIGRGVLGNKPASGTEIIEELGEEHMRTGDVIVYTSADSVFQVAAHEDVVPLEELYKICQIARELTLEDKHSVVRVIARPFVGEPGNFTRTANRRDFSVSPPGKTVMNKLEDAGYTSIALGKISDIYAGEGVTESIKTKSNMDGVDKLLNTMDKQFTGLAFINLVDFDALYGHRRNPTGYGEALEEFDRRLPEILTAITDDDLLIITADHGNDPIHHGTDHTREYVPLLVYHKGLTAGKALGIRETFADIGATIADNFGIEKPKIGTSFLHTVIE
ncbi:phosphopentomutase [Aneurinibacillus aneurinilyticus]|uniref:Phosphopentomutase n=2 Tax=Aneurinibacillus aneurinilyticus TaxID=1391 RepID=A0A848CP22_ANEAE|nr:phosphopentomutase [Aneurinibacillus aneurinilyticus]ERI05934.1 phosphopentomutase [Aneurinibacillus aneurinilyticus ATCC 12856]MED0672726.1 phosphopentomutase [Aneurinibacillus aneurinilyticus]MED0708553.1 phosphopentomutase [Aneurinibacillus aneurinilyticus]MED0721713.1 phosphopentomutase [Aneurinibacillus aneurinilyticus]MED0731837.1 phosphopentomutase [Aneurinibacillus aneurinilyticus]